MNALVGLRQWVDERPFWVGAAVAWLAVQALIAVAVSRGAEALGPDSLDFLRVSHQSIWSADFWGGTRAPMLPLLLRLLAYRNELVPAVHVVIGAVAWGALAVVVTQRMTTRVGRVWLFGSILLFSATLQVAIWHGMVMAESLSMSLTAAALALALVVPQRWSWLGIAATIVIGALLAFVRDTNSILLLSVVAAIVAGVAFRRVPLRALVAAAFLTLAAFGAMASSSSGDRWLQGMHHVTRDRILASERATEWFVDRGLPDVALVRSKAGNDYERGHIFFSDPRFADYLDWLRSHGRSALLSYLATHPFFLQEGRFASLGNTLGPLPSVRHYEGYLGIEPPLGSVVNAILWPESPYLVFPLYAAGLAAAVVVAVIDSRRRAVAVLALAAVVLGAALSVMTANLDTAETPRHVIVQSAMGRVGIVIAVVVAAEALAVAAIRRWLAAPDGDAPVHPAGPVVAQL